MLIIDDMISSGDSMLDVARQLKKRKAKRVFVASIIWFIYKWS